MTQEKQETKQAIIDAFHFRHATKKFDANKTIPEDDFQFIMETAHLSPSSFGFEPWRFLVIQNEALREKIKETSWGARGKIMDCSHFVIVLARTKKDTRYDSAYLQDHLKNVLQFPEEAADGLLQMVENFQKEDFAILEDEDRMADWASKQTYIALGNMMTAAAQIGIDSCPIEGFPMKEMNDLLREEGLLDDESFSISVMAAFGYRANDPAPKKRRPFDDVVKWVE
ncbi:NAD(P)H-flavin oxidoreductase [Gracilibacillus halophilus YIM-C55.5]|uniref:NAD(P)H-flavin oxidoreductase n=1 Tax=Gracilibacillus halophilus YIM-C55.5 TaxID=1308866 RepID=N4WQB9_9BACI|nr:NAD(P)H-dependent oxidoreductase [Gracilibacillus halophilus]ENH96650.1 NAD(P)H-flavin oxidoreductase [Gracilibacillus halophilus YIM-C55.5]